LSIFFIPQINRQTEAAFIQILIQLIKLRTMKYILFLFLLATTALNAQNVISDTTFTANINNQFFEVTRVNFIDGTYREQSKLIGDTTALVNYFENQMFNEFQRLAFRAQELQTADRTANRLIATDLQVTALVGTSPLLELQQSQDSALLLAACTINEVAATFTRTAAGKLRVSVGGQAFVVDHFGQALRLRNYPAAGQTTLLYYINDRLWADANRRVLLRVTPPALRRE
jgi:hypothetical protein